MHITVAPYKYTFHIHTSAEFRSLVFIALIVLRAMED